MPRSNSRHRKSKTAASAAILRSRAPAPRDEPKFEEYFDYGEGHTARILTPAEVVAITQGKYVPVTESKGKAAPSRPRRRGAHQPVESEALTPDPNYTVTYEDRFGRPLTMEDVIDFVEGRREPP